jgi:hypothetical protein
MLGQAAGELTLLVWALGFAAPLRLKSVPAQPEPAERETHEAIHLLEHQRKRSS